MSCPPTLQQCRSAADSYLRGEGLLFADADHLGNIVYLYALEWSSRFRALLGGMDVDPLEIPAIESQIWDCSGPVAEILDRDQDAMRVYFLLMDFLKSRAADGVRPFRYEATHDRELVVYG